MAHSKKGSVSAEMQYSEAVLDLVSKLAFDTKTIRSSYHDLCVRSKNEP
jgi:hypothetical protein